MVNEHPERALALAYAPADGRAALAALLALDDRLGAILRATREPLVGQMRLTWWHQALEALGSAPPPAEPVLAALAAEVLPRGVPAAGLAEQVEGWEALLDGDPADPEVQEAHARRRGGGLFAAAATALGGDPDAVMAAGGGWALADLAAHLSDRVAAGRAREAALRHLDGAFRRRWPRAERALGALALSARYDAAGKLGPGHPGRSARLALHRLTGR